MSWNNRVVVEPYTHKDGTVEYTASIREVYYGEKVGSTVADMTPTGTGFTEAEAINELRGSLELMLEATNFVIAGDTPVFKDDDKSTHIPGKPSMVIRRREVLDRDDDFMDEKYGEED